MIAPQPAPADDATPEAVLDGHLRRVLPEARVRLQPLPLAPALALWLIDPDTMDGPLPGEVAAAVMERPAYWAFCWASGQALAAHLLAHPERVAGKRVLDFGSGSGVVAIAAARAGARSVIACDIDPDALDAVGINARRNAGPGDAGIDCVADLAEAGPSDIVLVADVLYDPANLPLLEALLQRPGELLIADSRIAPDRVPAFEVVGEQTCTTLPDLDESPQFSRVRFYRPRAADDRTLAP